MERWATIAEFPDYLVSDHGRVIREATGRIMRPGGRTHRGAIQYHFNVDGKRYARYIHRLVAKAFINPNIDGLEVDHLDDDTTNNHLSNFEVVTPKVNSQRAYDRGRRVPPSRKTVRIVETNEQFDSISNCARALNRSLSTVSYALQKGTPTAGVHLEEVIS